MTQSELQRPPVSAIETPTAPYAQVVLDDRYAFIAGVVAPDVTGGRSALGDVGAETEAIMTGLRDALAELGLGMERIVRVDVHMTDISRIGEMNAVYRRFFPADALPARTCVGVAALVDNASVEITVMVRR